MTARYLCWGPSTNTRSSYITARNCHKTLASPSLCNWMAYLGNRGAQRPPPGSHILDLRSTVLQLQHGHGTPSHIPSSPRSKSHPLHQHFSRCEEGSLPGAPAYLPGPTAAHPRQTGNQHPKRGYLPCRLLHRLPWFPSGGKLHLDLHGLCKMARYT
jgi:hypothetical protein